MHLGNNLVACDGCHQAANRLDVAWLTITLTVGNASRTTRHLCTECQRLVGADDEYILAHCELAVAEGLQRMVTDRRVAGTEREEVATHVFRDRVGAD